jgi:hypothetical protein
MMSGQFALAVSEETIAPAMVWEALPAQAQMQVARRLARLLAALVEGERDE